LYSINHVSLIAHSAWEKSKKRAKDEAAGEKYYGKQRAQKSMTTDV